MGAPLRYRSEEPHPRPWAWAWAEGLAPSIARRSRGSPGPPGPERESTRWRYSPGLPPRGTPTWGTAWRDPPRRAQPPRDISTLGYPGPGHPRPGYRSGDPRSGLPPPGEPARARRPQGEGPGASDHKGAGGGPPARRAQGASPRGGGTPPGLPPRGPTLYRPGDSHRGEPPALDSPLGEPPPGPEGHRGGRGQGQPQRPAGIGTRARQGRGRDDPEAAGGCVHGPGGALPVAADDPRVGGPAPAGPLRCAGHAAGAPQAARHAAGMPPSGPARGRRAPKRSRQGGTPHQGEVPRGPGGGPPGRGDALRAAPRTARRSGGTAGSGESPFPVTTVRNPSQSVQPVAVEHELSRLLIDPRHLLVGIDGMSKIGAQQGVERSLHPPKPPPTVSRGLMTTTLRQCCLLVSAGRRGAAGTATG